MRSRGGDVLMHPEPVTTQYRFPAERVIFWPQRDANPFFHLFEGLWMLAGRNDVAFLKQFISDFDRFSDDGKIIHGAYGYRWRKHWIVDTGNSLGPLNQLRSIISLLQKHPNTRRAVLTMWDPEFDLREDESGRDLPCNTQAYFWNLAGRLQMTVTCRSNDAIWGCFGANAVHFSFLQEYLAAQIGCEVGSYYQVSNNFHAYLPEYRKVEELIGRQDPSPYETGEVEPYPLVENPKTWDRDLALFLEDPNAYGYDNSWFSKVAKPMWFAHKAWSNRSDPERYDKAFDIISQCRASDWRRAAAEWLGRRYDRTKSSGVLRDN